MPEGDTIHRAARRLDAALAGRVIERAEAPNPRSPLHRRAPELAGRTLESVEAKGKHLLAHFSGELVVHSHLGVNGRWSVAADGRLPHGEPWLLLAAGRGIASQRGGKILRLVSESRIRNDPALAQLGPDPLREGFDRHRASALLLRDGRGRDVGEALLDQRILAGSGNVIRLEACFNARISPWRKVADLKPGEAERLIAESERVMRASLAKGRRPSRIYKANRRGCPRCGGEVAVRGQGDANRVTYWCTECQR